MAKESEKTASAENKPDLKLQLLLVIIPAVVAITVAIIGCFSSVLPPLFASPVVQRLFDWPPTSTPTAVIQLNTPVSGESQPKGSPPTDAPFSIVETPITEVTSNPGGPVGMQAILYASTSSGNAPLRVKFDARSSYFIDATGTNYPCGPCNFTWQIRQGSNNIYGPETGTGSFEYRFGSKGTYFISVYVCRNGSIQDCAGNGTSVVVR